MNQDSTAMDLLTRQLCLKNTEVKPHSESRKTGRNNEWRMLPFPESLGNTSIRREQLEPKLSQTWPS